MSHVHNVIDSDFRFVINPATRSITNTSNKHVLMQYDHNSERFTFEIPRYIDGHDMSLCNLVEVHYDNVDDKGYYESNDVYVVSDLQVSPDSEDSVICSWLISQNATMYVGKLNFAVHFKCVTEGVLEYRWITDEYKSITIDGSIINEPLNSSEYSDTLASLKAELIDYIDNESMMWSTLNQSTLYVTRCADPTQNGTVLEVK